jgi:hypothetical protein
MRPCGNRISWGDILPRRYASSMPSDPLGQHPMCETSGRHAYFKRKPGRLQVPRPLRIRQSSGCREMNSATIAYRLHAATDDHEL